MKCNKCEMYKMLKYIHIKLLTILNSGREIFYNVSIELREDNKFILFLYFDQNARTHYVSFI